jgi:uncharacterized LabA/DUF88 family protein
MPRLAVLIDAENAQLSILGSLLAEIAKSGTPTVRRVYGDFTCTALASWREQMLRYSIHPIQQFRNTVRKNASDSALIIDAMDLLHTGRFEGFCIVSSDSDFTRLASRLREEGMLVYGYGEKHTPMSFISACDKFTYTEILRRPENDQPEAPPVVVHKNALGQSSDFVRLIVDAVESCADDSGWAALAAVGKVLSNHTPDFDPRHFGHKKLSDLVQATGQFELGRRGNDGTSPLYVKLKSTPSELSNSTSS